MNPTTTTDLLTYYATPGRMTDPGVHAHLFDGLPGDIAGLCRVVQGVLLHIFWAERYGVQLSEERKGEVQIRAVAPKLQRLLELDSSPLSVARPPERRLVGNCRDFSVLLCAMLRHQGVPARARCGFGTYFLPDHFEDHWVGEYWNAAEGRWVLVDAQLDALQCEAMNIPFDPLDVPRDQFVVAGQAWQMCRSGQADPDKFGIFDMHGLWFVRGNVVRDFLSFNKVEILPWDHGWGFLDAHVPTEEEAKADTLLFDHFAGLTLAGDGAFAEIRSSYESDPRWPIPAEW